MLGCDVLDRVDGHDGVESFDEAEFSETDVFEIDGDAAVLRLASMFVDWSMPRLVSGGCDEGGVAAVAAWASARSRDQGTA